MSQSTITAPHVIDADDDFVTISVRGERRQVSWYDLDRAARQEDPDAARVYRQLQEEAQQLVNALVHERKLRTLTVTVREESGHADALGTYTWRSCAFGAGGSPVRLRGLVNAGYGMTGWRSQAEQEAREIADTLTASGYHVTLRI